MIRFRGKAIGLGLALAAGPFAAAQPPALLPPTVRGNDWASGAPADPVWFPARTLTRPAAPVAAPPVVPSGQPPAVPFVAPQAAPNTAPPAASNTAPPTVANAAPPAAVRPAQAEAEPVTLGPRSAPLVSELGPLPNIPALPEPAGPAPQPFPVVAQVVPAPPLPEVMPTRSTIQPQPAPPPRAVEPPAPKTVPTPQPSPLPPPTPTPSVPPSDAPLRPQPTPGAPPELPTAPPELLVPVGYQVPGRRGTFGSAPVNISRDYPTLRELFQFTRPDAAGAPGLADDGDNPGTAPAQDRGYVRLEYLLWWVNPQRIPVLASTSANGGLGFLGDPGTSTLLGPGRFGNSLFNGFRVRGGWWFDDEGTCGIDGGFFFLGRNSKTDTFDSSTIPTITRPFFAPNDGGAEFGERVARPGFSSGTLDVNGTSSLYGFDVNLRHALCKTCGFRDEVFVGYRFLGLSESLTITENITALPGNTVDPAGTQIVVQDKFQTRNWFNGGQIGYAAERNWGRVSLNGRVSVALGDTHQTVDVSGYQLRQRPGEAAMLFTNGGLLAAGPNIGRFTDDRFSVVPEVSLNLGYWFTPRMKAYVGYNALFWSNVVRPGDQVDRTVDVTFIPNPPINPATGQPPAFSGQNRPVVPFHQDSLWVNGIQFGAEWRW
ncbi:MAG TPA: BBP7 family outer membrane beta-barrel protein [Urbifossiella sp.]|nr:BBP7 family outer membrane beta-barrel protein [Urbifossiella sp.]